MAHNLRIFESAPIKMNPRLCRGQEFIAWAIWLWQVGVVGSLPRLIGCSFRICYRVVFFNCFFVVLIRTQSYYDRRATFVENSPAFEAPDPDVNPEWYGEVYIRYSLSPTITHMYLGHVMKATVNLRIIMKNISLLHFASTEPTALFFEQVLKLRARLDALMQNLPTTLAPSGISLPCHSNVQQVPAPRSIIYNATNATISNAMERHDSEMASQSLLELGSSYQDWFQYSQATFLRLMWKHWLTLRQYRILHDLA
jgi:hypothetical protein